jgi:endogenous inhibitor of DNA gyrase (YacG/DUF329 family)
MVCPTCKVRFKRSATKFPPFCSERCKLIDLSHWLDGGYVIPGEPADVTEHLPTNGDNDEEGEP